MQHRPSRLPLAGALALVCALVLVALWFTREPAPPPSAGPKAATDRSTSSGESTPRTATVTLGTAPTPAPHVAPRAAEPRSELVDGLNDPRGTIANDLQLLNEVFSAWLTHYRDAGIPIGDNREITAALTGANSLGYAFVPADHPALNARGELCDRWGTPFRFHVLSRLQMEIRSAGPDRRFGTDDDAEWAPWPRNF